MDADFYFNEWAFLAKVDPVLFEQRRKEALADFLVQSGAHRAQLERLQSKVDCVRERAATPEQAMAAICGMMCASLVDLAGEMTSLSSDLKRLQKNSLLHVIAEAGERRAAGGKGIAAAEMHRAV